MTLAPPSCYGCSSTTTTSGSGGSHGNDTGAAAATTTSGGGALGRIDRNLLMVFTCGRCETRAAKAFSRRSYEHGIVLVRCPGCQSTHLIADNLGWFGGGKTNVEKLLQSKGGQGREGAPW